jgi:hypothetical protein
MKTAILCRTNAPLVACAFDLIKKGRGIKVRIVGRDVAKKLKELVGEVLDYRRNSPIEEFLVLLDGWIGDIHDRFGDNEKHENFVAECDDYYGCLKAICTNCKDAECVYKTIDSFFIDSDEISDKDDSIILCSGHRSKGLEWDRVVVLRPDLMPHPGARTEADQRQEQHLEYVILTRGKEELIICHDTEPR